MGGAHGASRVAGGAVQSGLSTRPARW
jgi:hypothetical protein